MNPDDLIAAVKEAFGQHAEDVLSPAKMADEAFGWLHEIFISIQREVEGEMVSGKVSVTGASYRVLRVLRAFPRSNQKCPVLSPAPLRERCLHFCDCHRILKGTLRCLTACHASASDLMAKNQA